MRPRCAGATKSPGAPVWVRWNYCGAWGSWSISPKTTRRCWGPAGWPAITSPRPPPTAILRTFAVISPAISAPLSKAETPLSQGLSRYYRGAAPDVLVYNTNQCREVKDWFQWYSRRCRVPCLGVENFRQVDEVTALHLQAISAQLRSWFPPWRKYRAPASTSSVCGRPWSCPGGPVSSGGRYWKPRPIGPALSLFSMARFTWGRPWLPGELKPQWTTMIFCWRNSEGVSPRGGGHGAENFRLFWDGMPIWGKLRDLAALFSELKTCVVASTYCNSWIFSELDPETRSNPWPGPTRNCSSSGPTLQRRLS